MAPSNAIDTCPTLACGPGSTSITTLGRGAPGAASRRSVTWGLKVALRAQQVAHVARAGGQQVVKLQGGEVGHLPVAAQVVVFFDQLAQRLWGAYFDLEGRRVRRLGPCGHGERAAQAQEEGGQPASSLVIPAKAGIQWRWF